MAKNIFATKRALLRTLEKGVLTMQLGSLASFSGFLPLRLAITVSNTAARSPKLATSSFPSLVRVAELRVLLRCLHDKTPQVKGGFLTLSKMRTLAHSRGKKQTQ